MPKRKRRIDSHHVGRLRVKAAEILRANFPDWDVRPEDVRPATGSYRTCIYHDVYRWELFTRTTAGLPVVVGCWDTLPRFVVEAGRRGCRCSDGEIYVGKLNANDEAIHDEKDDEGRYDEEE